MEDLTLALITLTSFVLLFVVAIFADRAGMETSETTAEPVLVPVDESPVLARSVSGTSHIDTADVA